MGFQFSLLPCLVGEKESRNPIESGNTWRPTNNSEKNSKSFSTYIPSFNSLATKQSNKPSKLTKQIVMITNRDCMKKYGQVVCGGYQQSKLQSPLSLSRLVGLLGI